MTDSKSEMKEKSCLDDFPFCKILKYSVKVKIQQSKWCFRPTVYDSMYHVYATVYFKMLVGFFSQQSILIP